jgi:CheY-like chemotaxis protein
MKHFDILIVDDEQRYADMLAKRLGLRSLTCKVCYDGQTAIDIVEEESFSVVILDLRLPDLYGTEVLTRIKQCRPETAVIILTGHGTEKDREQCMAPRGAFLYEQTAGHRSAGGHHDPDKREIVMMKSLNRLPGAIWPRFHRNNDEHLNPYYTFQDYRQTWGMTIFILMMTALVPLVVMTLIYYQLIETSINTESLLRTERLASNARRAVTFFWRNAWHALTFTVNEMGYDQLTNPGHLSEVLRNLKLGFGGLTDLSVIADTGTQVTYAGPFNLEGKDYSNQPWFMECQQHNACVSEIFSGYRDVPHIVVAVKSMRPDGRFFVLRATLETERLIQTLSSYKTGEHADIFLVNRNGLLQTPSQFYEGESHRMDIPLPTYSDRTKAVMSAIATVNPSSSAMHLLTPRLPPHHLSSWWLSKKPE